MTAEPNFSDVQKLVQGFVEDLVGLLRNRWEERRAGQVILARNLAAEAHDGQVDKIGEPYFQHAEWVSSWFQDDPVLEAAGYLHDAVEDTDWTLDTLRDRGVDEGVVQLVDHLTRRRDEHRETYLIRLAEDPRAVKIKLADISHNLRPDRLGRIADADERERLVRKYSRTLSVLAREL